MKRPFILAGLICAACWGVHGIDSVEAQELLSNGNFSAGVLAPWTFTAEAGAESTIAASVVPFSGSNAARVNTGSATSGVEAGGTLSQIVALVAGQSYQVSAGTLAIASVNGSPNADGGTITVSLAGSLLHTFDVGLLQANEVKTDSFSVPFVAAATGPAQFSVTLRRSFPNFAATPGVYHYVDNLSVASVVPEPATATLGALGALVLIRVRRGTSAR